MKAVVVIGDAQNSVGLPTVKVAEPARTRYEFAEELPTGMGVGEGADGVGVGVVAGVGAGTGVGVGVGVGAGLGVSVGL